MPESADRTPTGDLRERLARVIARRVPGCTTLFTGTLADAVLPVVEAETAALRAALDEQTAIARQTQEVLDIAHDTSNTSERERARAVQRAEEAERKHAQALDAIADERRARLEAEAAARRVRQALARKTLLAGPRAEKAVRVADVEAALDAEQPSVCCDLHGLPCEPPSELCCRSCTEANHPQHPAGVRCVLDQPEETR